MASGRSADRTADLPRPRLRWYWRLNKIPIAPRDSIAKAEGWLAGVGISHFASQLGVCHLADGHVTSMIGS